MHSSNYERYCQAQQSGVNTSIFEMSRNRSILTHFDPRAVARRALTLGNRVPDFWFMAPCVIGARGSMLEAFRVLAGSVAGLACKLWRGDVRNKLEVVRSNKADIPLHRAKMVMSYGSLEDGALLGVYVLKSVIV